LCWFASFFSLVHHHAHCNKGQKLLFFIAHRDYNNVYSFKFLSFTPKKLNSQCNNLVDYLNLYESIKWARANVKILLWKMSVNNEHYGYACMQMNISIKQGWGFLKFEILSEFSPIYVTYAI
jgi:hypothetical protein